MNKKIIITSIIGILIIGIIIGIVLLNKFNDGIGSAGISLQEFNKIELGMSNSKVNSIIDEKDEWDDDIIYNKACKEVGKEKNNHIYSYTYKYIGENGGYALITYTANYSGGDVFVMPTVSQKEQFNLK